MSLTFSRSTRTRRHAAIAIGLLACMAAAAAAAWRWGRVRAYSADPPATVFEVPSRRLHSLQNGGTHLIASQLEGWRLRLWRIGQPTGREPAPPIAELAFVDLAALTRRALLEAEGTARPTERPGKRDLDQKPTDPKQSDAKRSDPVGDEAPPGDSGPSEPTGSGPLAADASQSYPAAADPGQADRKPPDPKLLDSKRLDSKRSDPRLDRKQPDSKQNAPKLDPKQLDPKQRDPKEMDPTQDPTQNVQQSPVQAHTPPPALRDALGGLDPPAVAIGAGGTAVAWVSGRNLLTALAGQPASVRLSRLSSAGCAPELGDGILLLVCPDGRVEIRDGGDLRVLTEAAGGGPWAISKIGDRILASSGSELFDIGGDVKPFARVSTRFDGRPRAAAVSTGRQYALASDDGNVVLTFGSAAGITVAAPGVVDALAFLDESRLLVAGAFRGIHILRPDGAADALIPDVVGTRYLVALGDRRVAYATSDRVRVAQVRTAMAFTAAGKGLLGFAGALWLPLILLLWQFTPRGEAVAPTVPAAHSPGADLTLPRPDPPAGLVRACAQGECVLYAGAGMSAQAGYPTWQPFVASLLDWSTKAGKIDPVLAESLIAALTAGQVDPVADSLVSALGKPDVLARLSETFGREQRLPDAHRLLKRIPFCAALTANFDTLLERTYPEATDRVLTPRDAERLQELLGRRQFFIGKLYGSLADPHSVVVTAADYAELISHNLPFSQSLEGLFVSRTLLFVGASLEGIEAYLSGLTFRGQMTRPHYALVAVTGAGWRAKADQLRRRYGIEVVPYNPSPSFEEVPQFLQRLAEALSAADHPAAAAGGGAEGVRRLVLQNIGPFPHLELELQPDWNVILGDNGVGKSSVLRAIAACFCGRDAAPYAGRLIRAGEMSGSIVLETVRNTYRMELRRKDNIAEVNVVPSRPLEAEGVLALGFPPLRAVSWERPKGPSAEGRRRATVEDLLPIVKGDPDPRLDKLKQWIVNLDARINYERSQGGDDRYERLLTRFFEIVDQVTPGMAIRYGHVNPDTREVSVITDDGEIPIEMISQGSVSLMGWIGVLLQRLYEIYGDDEDPTRRYALVLIDEIDAHMHPEWQQSVVQHMNSIFPNVQYIATTHSPLVVGGMDGRQVLRFVRNDAGETTRVPVTNEMLLGRADQILTGRLFGMKTTLDQQTQGLMDRYKTLLGKSQRSPEEEEEFHRLHHDLKFKIPIAEETSVERKAFALVEAIVNDQLGALAPQARQPMLDKARALIDEINASASRAL